MHIVEGRAADIETDRERTRGMLDRTADTGEPAVRAWTPHRQVAFGRRDAHADGFERAKRAATARGYPVVERRVGGRAVAYTGNTVAFARTEPVAGERTGIEERYARTATDLRAAMGRLDVEATAGEPPDSFCPGSHSLQSAGKIVGIAQRVTSDAALVAGIVVVRDHDAIADVLAPVYSALDVPFDPDSVGSVARAGGDGDPNAAVEAVGTALVDGWNRSADRNDGRSGEPEDDRGI